MDRTVDEWVEELLLTATNEGQFYQDFLATARTEAWTQPEQWAGYARQHSLRYRYRFGGEEFTPEIVLKFAVALEAYYREHVKEVDET